MQILAADDERMALSVLTKAIQEACPDAELHAFQDPHDLLEFARTVNCAVAFLDIQMQGMDGLSLAKQLKDLYPTINIVFVTGFSEYAGNAFQIRASGYVMKPATKEKILAELENLRHPPDHSVIGPRLRVQCFGNFEVFLDGKPLRFALSRTKELLAYLVDRRGAAANTGELCAVLWEDANVKTQKVQLRKLVADLSHTLEQADLPGVFLKERNSFAIRQDQIDCDYYRFLCGDPWAVNLYQSEYMVQYSWAEMTLGTLERTQTFSNG